MRNKAIQILLLSLLVLCPNVWADRPKVIAGFGSSVCDGAGDHPDQGGYIGRLAELMAKRGWLAIDVSRGGDTTVTIQDRWQKTDHPPIREVAEGRYLLPHQPGYVIVGLSLANEGIRRGDEKEREKTFEQFRSGMLGIIDRCRKEGMRVVVTNCYPHGEYTPEQYECIKRMNLIINSWDVPSINLLGSIDDGQGRWVDGFWHDPGHPNGGGHEEMFLAIVPSLFDAMEAGKPLPKLDDGRGGMRVHENDRSALIYTPDDTIHSFTTSFSFTGENNTVLAEITGKKGVIETSEIESNGETLKCSIVIESAKEFKAVIEIQDGKLAYDSSSGVSLISLNKVADGQWHQVSLSHRCARGETLFFVDGALLGIVEGERLIPQQFSLGVSGSTVFKDWLIHRSSLNAGEVQVLHAGTLIQSSLEIYAPLRDRQFDREKPVINDAQSLSQIIVIGDGVEPIEK